MHYSDVRRDSGKAVNTVCPINSIILHGSIAVIKCSVINCNIVSNKLQ